MMHCIGIVNILCNGFRPCNPEDSMLPMTLILEIHCREDDSPHRAFAKAQGADN